MKISYGEGGTLFGYPMQVTLELQGVPGEEAEWLGKHASKWLVGQLTGQGELAAYKRGRADGEIEGLYRAGRPKGLLGWFRRAARELPDTTTVEDYLRRHGDLGREGNGEL